LHERFDEIRKLDTIDQSMGFDRYTEGVSKYGWLVNMHSTLVKDDSWAGGRSAVDLYFLQEDGGSFKATFVESPYFYVVTKKGMQVEFEEFVKRKFGSIVERIEIGEKEDLALANHLVSEKQRVVKLVFRNTADLISVRKVLMPAAEQNKERMMSSERFEGGGGGNELVSIDPMEDVVENKVNYAMNGGLESVIELREHDISYHLRVSIDHDIRIGYWYTAKAINGNIKLERDLEKQVRADPVVMAFDIETTKLPLKFPDAQIDSIMMISYMIDGQGYLITNRDIISEDIEDFEYTPKPEFEGPFIIFNEENEKCLLERFFEHIQQVRPTVIATYNGDSFDWPFVEERAKINGMSMFEMIGFQKDSSDEYKSTYCIHMDCFRWVKRDSYLPVGSHGLKAVTSAKLGYNPMELDPEDMTPFAREKPQVLATYSVSDAVATYYLYMKYVHPFIFSLCNIIPLNPDEVLRKGSGTLCETLLMVESFKANVLMPNRHVETRGKFYKGHLLENETYVGGHVEALESGVFRSDIETEFKMNPKAFRRLINELDEALKFALRVEMKIDFEQVENYAEVYEDIKRRLEELEARSESVECPLIYHLDVAAMYPNIILTNRLQPPAIVDEKMCASCDFNKPGKTCQRRMEWDWRGEYMPARKNEYRMIKNQLESEKFDNKSFYELSKNEQQNLIEKRLGQYCRKVYRKNHEHEIVKKTSIVCQRENPFYVDTVKCFRDRRYEYKGLHKKWKKEMEEAVKQGDLGRVEESKKMIILYDSLQLAHKCILNSFYGYVMRKGARWYSMEMAGIVCHTGAMIIRMARELIEMIGRPLELDTDGIWCILPERFPENFKFRLKNGKEIVISYPCVMLNYLVYDKFTNDQYEDLDVESGEYKRKSENSIFFEIDGPYKAMILPASKEQDKLLKKRYAVFNKDDTLAELKGFEVKRRGELKLIKYFQSEIFNNFLKGSNLKECYESVSVVANHWLNILYSKGEKLTDEELFDLISEKKSMSRSVEEYAGKSTSISTAKRLAEFLGSDMIKDKGLACQFVICSKPVGSAVTDRAIPIAIFSTEESVKHFYLRKWLKDPLIEDFDIRSLLDWEYYIERLASAIQKIITIPAAMQNVENPVPRIRHPEWLERRIRERKWSRKQKSIKEYYKVKDDEVEELGVDELEVEERGEIEVDIEDLGKVEDELKEKMRELEIKDESMSLMFNDFSKWIEGMKKRWNNKKKNEKKSLFDKQNEIFKKNEWEIIQIVETFNKGEYKIISLINNQIKSVLVCVPRVFYINSLFELNSEDLRVDRVDVKEIKRVEYKLPRNHSVVNLYQVEMTEKEFELKQRELQVLFNHPSVIGVYELNVPLDFKIIMQIGNKCKIRNNLLNVLNLNQLESTVIIKTNTNTSMSLTPSYLSGGLDGINFCFLFDSFIDKKRFVGCVLNNKIFICFINATISINLVKKIYNENYIKFESKEKDYLNEFFIYSANPIYEIHSVSNLKELTRLLNKFLANKQDLIILESFVNKNERISSMLNLEGPIINIPFNFKQIRSLDWNQLILTKFIKRYFELNSWFESLLELSKYSKIPIGNLKGDISILSSDVLYARCLKQQGFLLWYSENESPDLSGREFDNHFNFVDNSFDVSVSGSFKSICVELNVANLCINTIIESKGIESKGISSSTQTTTQTNATTSATRAHHLSKALNLLNENTLNKDHFLALKNLVLSWSQDVARFGNYEADSLLANFYRWIKSPSSKLYDPLMFNHINQLMNKLFIQLLNEFKSLGVKIIFANFNKIILQTSKQSIFNAIPFVDFLLKETNSKDLFCWIEFRIVKYYNYLLWLDKNNYADFDYQHSQQLDSVNSLNSQLVMNWHIQNFLPPAIQNTFHQTVAEFITYIYSCIDDTRENRLPPSESSHSSNQMFSESDLYESSGIFRNQKEFFEKFNSSILSIVREMQTKFAHHDDDSCLFPTLPGSHLDLKYGPLEFIKSICAIFALEADLKHLVLLLRRHLLTLLSIKEFDPSTVFTNPSESLILPNMFCASCNSISDLDICRDTDFACAACAHLFDKQLIQQTLVMQFYDLLKNYQVQDLVCGKCRMVANTNLTDHCQCSGSFANSLKEEVVMRRVRVLKSVAEVYQMEIYD
ncbi:DNA/RNA polymerase, partial [Rozella allomycis CSF55]